MEEKIVPYEAVLKIAGHRVLVIAPHPDDEVFGCGGAIMRHADAGDVLQIVIVTNGAYLADAARQVAHSEMRQAESRQAAAVMGCDRPTFWGMPDRGVEYGEVLVERIAQAIGALEADLVYAPSVFEMHPDHRAIGMAALEAARRSTAKPQLAMYEVGIPMPRINTLLDISDLVDRKQRAMVCFGSQLTEQAYDQHVTALNKYRTFTLGKQVSAAEAYFLASADAISTDFLGVFASEHERQRRLGLAIASEDVPLVSVLIRSFGRPLLGEALDSVALQTYSHIEVVVVNAQAPAHRKLGDLCGRFPMRTVNTEEALSLSQAANIALDNAKGDFLIFLDDDAWLAPDHIANLVGSMLVHPDRRVAYAGVELRGEHRQPLDLKPFNEPFSAGRLRGDDYIPLHAVLFSQKLLGNTIRFDERLKACEDWDFLLQLSTLTKFIHVDRVSAYDRATSASGIDFVADDTKNSSAREQIFSKWKSIWSGAHIEELVRATANTAQERGTQQQDDSMNQMRDQLHQLHIQLDQRNSTLSDQENALSRMGRSVDGSGATVAELRTQLREKDQSILASEARIQAVFASTSWKLSAPIRWVGRVARYAKRRWVSR